MPADLSPFKPHFVRALGAVAPRPTLARFEVQGGLRVILRDAARAELVLRVGPPEQAPGALRRTDRSAVDVAAGALSGPHHEAWVEAVMEAIAAAEASPAWPAFLTQAWAT